MKRPKLDQMTTEQRLKYLKDTDHLVLKWINRLDRPRDSDGTTMYHAGQMGGFELVSNRICDAIIHDVKFFAEKIEGYTLVSVTKKQLFEARLKGV